MALSDDESEFLKYTADLTKQANEAVVKVLGEVTEVERDETLAYMADQEARDKQAILDADARKRGKKLKKLGQRIEYDEMTGEEIIVDTIAPKEHKKVCTIQGKSMVFTINCSELPSDNGVYDIEVRNQRDDFSADLRRVLNIQIRKGNDKLVTADPGK